MKRLTPADFTHMPWRNGGGVTAEIAKHEDENGLIWRLSTARVEADCAYSPFPGLTRLSAVVEGRGVHLTNTTNDKPLTANPFDIVALSGDALYHGALIDGGIRHLNLVFDPKRVSAEMLMIGAGWAPLQPDLIHAVYCIEGTVTGAGFDAALPGDVLIGEDAGSVVLAEGTRAALIFLDLKRKTAPRGTP